MELEDDTITGSERPDSARRTCALNAGALQQQQTTLATLRGLWWCIFFSRLLKFNATQTHLRAASRSHLAGGPVRAPTQTKPAQLWWRPSPKYNHSSFAKIRLDIKRLTQVFSLPRLSSHKGRRGATTAESRRQVLRSVRDSWRWTTCSEFSNPRWPQ